MMIWPLPLSGAARDFRRRMQNLSSLTAISIVLAVGLSLAPGRVARAQPAAAAMTAPDANAAFPTTPEPAATATPAKSPCETIEGAATAYGLPVEFFVRLIWQESNFNPKSVSPAGAQGIAQFMPGTARWRGLADPFDTVPALYESARWLSELRIQFGNLGLAAAAYNGGPGRLSDWLAGRGSLPGETRAYVRIITGRRAEEWIGVPETAAVPAARGACQDLARQLRARSHPAPEPEIPQDETAWGPWGLQLLGNWSQAKAFDGYRRLQQRFPAVLGDRKPMIVRRRMAGRGAATWYLLRVAESTRERAASLCSRLISAGGACLVLRN